MNCKMIENNEQTKKWALCETVKSFKQCSVAFKSQETYAYASNYATKETDIAVIGTRLKGTSFIGKTSGKIGTVSEIAQSFSADRKYLLTLDFAFSDTSTKKMLKSSANILEEEMCEGNLSNDPNTLEDIILHPITFMVRKIFAALTILAFPEHAESAWTENATAFLKNGIFKSTDVAALKEIIDSSPFDSLAMKMWEPYFPDLEELRQRLLDLEQSESIYPECDKAGFYEEHVYLPGKRNKAYREYLIESSFAGAINIMVQADMTNLLGALLKIKPKLKDQVNKIKSLYQP